MPSSNTQGNMPVRAASRSRHTRLRHDLWPLGLPSKNGEFANSAVATGCKASATRSFCTMSASDPKSRFTCTVQVRRIMTRPLVPTLVIYSFISLYRPLGIRSIWSWDHSGAAPKPMNPAPIRSATSRTSRRWVFTSSQVSWMVSTGAPAPSLTIPISLPPSSTGSQPWPSRSPSNMARIEQSPS